MKRVWILISCFPQVLWAQYHFDFEDGITSGEGRVPFWKMEQIPAERWRISDEDAISGLRSLRHSFDNPESGVDYFVIHHEQMLTGEPFSVSFRIRHGYLPSGANNWQMAFLANLQESETDGEEITEGILLGVNFRESDDLVRIWRIQDGLAEVLCSSTLNYQEIAGTGTSPFFSLECNENDNLKLLYTPDPLVLPAGELASFRTGILPSGRSVVIRYKYSAGQDRKLWLDNINLTGHFYRDTLPPGITGWDLPGDSRIALYFSERVITPDRSGFQLMPDNNNGIISSGIYQERDGIFPDSVFTEDTALQLVFKDPVPNRQYMALFVTGVSDREGNCLEDTLIRIFRNDAVWGDIVFNEIMFDPDPQVDISIGEYAEIYNRSDYPLDLAGWKVQANDRVYHLSESDYMTGNSILETDRYAVIRNISLPNRGSYLLLYSSNEELIHATGYRIPSDGPDWKKEGGWSLESPDPDMVCNIYRLWRYSVDPSGGTPGRVNSVDAELRDLDAPVFLHYGFGPDNMISLQFSEPVRFPGNRSLMAGAEREQFKIEPGGIRADSVKMLMPLSDQLACYFPVDPSALKEFRIRVPGVADCMGNLSGDLNLRAGSVSHPSAGSTLINEIMFDPVEGAPEFIELYHPGPGFTDLSDLSLDVVEENETPRQFAALSFCSRIIPPGSFVVLTCDTEQLMDAYGLSISGNWVEMDGFKSLPNTGGVIYLADRSGNTVDMAAYSENFHLELIHDTRGISLERIGFELPGNAPENWHSAASVEGYSTPGRENSQSVRESYTKDQLALEPGVFSPDNDGYNDLLKITTSTQEPGSVIRLWITDLCGKTVRDLANNHIAGPVTYYIWDGTRDNGQMVEEGLYVVHLRYYHPASGARWSRRAAIAVIYP